MKTLFITAVVFFAICIASGCFIFSTSPQKMYDRSADQVFDAIIVPGVPFEPEDWSLTMKVRVYWGKYLFDKGRAKNIIYSGSAVYTPYIEAEIMALYGESLGIPKANIFIESKAEHTTENVYYAVQLAKKQGFKSIALATDPFQSKMVRGFTKKVIPEVVHIPIVYDSLSTIEKIDPIIDHKQAFVQDFVALPDREGWWERLKGTRGKKIQFEGKDDYREIQRN